MSDITKDGIKVESIETLEGLKGQLVQVYYPGEKGYVAGVLKKVEPTKRIKNGEEIKDVTIYLKNGVERPDKPIPLSLYEKMQRTGRAIPEVFIPRTKERGIRYMLLLQVPEEEIS